MANKKLKLGFFALLAFIVLGIGGFSLLVKRSVAQSRLDFADNYKSERISESLDLYIEDGLALENFEFFTNIGRKGEDAGPYLNSKVEWSVFGKIIPGANPLPEELRKERLASKRSVHSWAMETKDWRLDFDWMRELRRFSAWDTAIDSKTKVLYPSLGAYIWINFMDLQTWSVLRMRSAQTDKQAIEALNDARALSHLLASAEDSHSKLIAVNNLGIEEKVMAKRNLDWKFIPEEARKRAKRFLYSANSLADPRIPAEKWALAVNLGANRCGAANAIMGEAISIRHVTAFSEFVSRVQRLVDETAGICADSFSRRLWNDPAMAMRRKDMIKFYEYVDSQKMKPREDDPYPAVKVLEFIRPSIFSLERLPWISVQVEEGTALFSIPFKVGFSAYKKNLKK